MHEADCFGGQDVGLFESEDQSDTEEVASGAEQCVSAEQTLLLGRSPEFVQGFVLLDGGSVFLGDGAESCEFVENAVEFLLERVSRGLLLLKQALSFLRGFIISVVFAAISLAQTALVLVAPLVLLPCIAGWYDREASLPPEFRSQSAADVG